MTSPDDPSHSYARRVLLAEEWETDAEWPDESGIVDETTNSAQSADNLTRGLTRSPRGYYEFLSGVRGLKDWIFHQYDIDFHPSIPHGHLQGRNQPKLDPYLGWIYQGTKQIDRKPKKIIVDLWNESEFREFASLAIDFYIRKFPHFRWRVAHPRRLPRKR
jgi:hypothetical protein